MVAKWRFAMRGAGRGELLRPRHASKLRPHGARSEGGGSDSADDSPRPASSASSSAASEDGTEEGKLSSEEETASGTLTDTGRNDLTTMLHAGRTRVELTRRASLTRASCRARRRWSLWSWPPQPPRRKGASARARVGRRTGGRRKRACK